MAQDFKLPDIGEGIAEGEIVKWLVGEGDTVEEHQPVVEVMTDKATVEIPAPRAGKITALKAGEGDVVPVGEVIFSFEAGEGASGDGDGGSDEPAKAASGNGSEGKGGSRSKGGGSKRGSKKKSSSGGGSKRSKGGSGGGGKTLEFELPDIGEGIAEGEIVKWLVDEGDQVEEHQPVVEVMTDKATVEIPAPASGTVAKHAVSAGDVVPIGTVIFHLETAGGGASEESEEESEEEAAEAAEPAPVTAAAATTAPSPEKKPARRSGGSSGNGKVLAVPSARRVARDLGVDLAEVEGTGKNGVIRRKDVEAFFEEGGASPAAAPAKAPPAAPALGRAEPVALEPGERETRTPFRGVRRKIADAMARSKYTATHFTVVEELDVTELVATRAKAKAIGEREGVKVTYMPFIMKACAAALARHPMLNASLDESTQELVRYHYVNLGVATDTENGLIVPVIREVQSKGMLQLARELAELAERTRSGKVKSEELTGGTFTITNAGNIGGTLATPIINFPEVAILGVHRIVKRPGVVETPDGDEIAVRQYMNLSVSVDHRLADGADAARFLVTMKELLEDPGLIAL